MLIEKRSEMNMLEENEMVFGLPNSEDGIINSSMTLRKFATEYCEKPENVTSTKLRKYLATACQMLELGETGKDYLANHLGHQIAENTQFYRQHADAVEVAKVSQILLLAEKGKLHKSAGRTINNLDVEDVLIDAEEMTERSKRRKYGSNVDKENDGEDSDDDIEIVAEKGNSDIEVLSSDSSDDDNENDGGNGEDGDTTEVRTMRDEYGEHLSRGMFNVQNEILKNVSSQLKESEQSTSKGEKRKTPDDERKIKKPSENLSAIEQINFIEAQNNKKKRTDRSNKQYNEEKAAIIEKYSEQIQKKVIPKKDELIQLLDSSDNQMIISWHQIKEILTKEVDKIRKRDNDNKNRR